MAESAMDGTATEPVTIDGRDIIVLYGSETGNAEEIAMELAAMTRRLHFKTVVDEMDNIKLVGSIPTLSTLPELKIPPPMSPVGCRGINQAYPSSDRTHTSPTCHFRYLNDRSG